MRRLRVTLVAACLLLGLGAEWVSYRPGALAAAAADLAVGWVLIGCGLVAWDRRGRRRFGLLIAASGVAWFLGGLVPEALYLHRGLLVHALLSYPDGRLRRRLSRLVVAAAYVDGAIEPLGPEPVVTLVALRRDRGRGDRRLPARDRAAATGARRRDRRCGHVRRRPRVRGGRAAGGVGPRCGGPVGVRGRARRAGDRSARRPAARPLVAACRDRPRGRSRRAPGAGHAAGPARPRTRRQLPGAGLVAGPGAWLRGRGGPAVPHRRGGREPRGHADRERAASGSRVLVHDRAVLDDRALVEAVAAATRIAVGNVRLQAEVRARVEQLAASRRRIVEAEDAQRRRLEHELHDGAERRLDRSGRARRGARARRRRATCACAPGRRSRPSSSAARAEVTELAHGIHPSALTTGGLAVALAELTSRGVGPRRVACRRRALPRGRRGGGVLRVRRGADERREVRARVACADRGASRGRLGSSSRSSTTVWAAPTRSAGRACAVFAIASRRSAVSSASRAIRGRARGSCAEIPTD